MKELEGKMASQPEKLLRLKEKIRDILEILKTWKQYTNVLALTSAQIIKNQYGVGQEMSINQKKREVMNQLNSQHSQHFMGSIEEDT